jgi:8-oxo-dGTP diphosphatase
MSPVNLRHSVRAVILDEEDRVLLCRFAIPEPAGTRLVWALEVTIIAEAC